MKKRTDPKPVRRATPADRKETAHDASGPPAEAFAGLTEWAAEVADCLTRGELGALTGMYRKIAGDRRVSAENRKLARRQAQALQKHSD